MTGVVDEHKLRQQLVEQYKYAEKLGLNELASGNLSVRFEDGRLISASGATADNISVDSLVQVSLNGDWQGSR
ncbi:MAG: hypothetical protein HOL98_02750 [Gammaproteobacteria bacterium]|nr:hypothetical protein [Gammaproteobacteria bacterium]MBT5202353.1 hypothetical protein [Gammaproteobacteria bacterium]MBT5603612.1 hypothetical protein [Gammaproteobacteria bacterium]MBT6245757.1 hypothetical protein [Gammaproteobacteria bacterium]